MLLTDWRYTLGSRFRSRKVRRLSRRRRKAIPFLTVVAGIEMLEVRTLLSAAPVFDPSIYSESVSEDAAVADAVTTVSATDGDGDSLTYALTIIGNESGHFAIDANTGAITVAAGLDYEQNPSYSLTVEASDGTLIGTATVDVTINDVNEAPEFDISEYYLYAPEDTPLGTIVYTAMATDDEGDVLTYSLLAGAGNFSVNSAGDIELTSELDYDSIPDDFDADGLLVKVIYIQVKVEDPIGNSDTMDVFVEVQKVDGPANLLGVGNPGGLGGAAPGATLTALRNSNATIDDIATALEATEPNWIAFLDWALAQGYVITVPNLSDSGDGYEVNHGALTIRLDSFDDGVFGAQRTDAEMAGYLHEALEEILEHHWGDVPQIEKIAEVFPLDHEILSIVTGLGNGALAHWGAMTNIFGDQNRCYSYALAMYSEVIGNPAIPHPNFTIRNVIWNSQDGGVFITKNGVANTKNLYVHVHPTWFGPWFMIETNVDPALII